MKPTQLLSLLREQNVLLWADGGELHYRAPAGALTPALLEQIRENKPALCEFFQRVGSPAQSSNVTCVRSDGPGIPIFFLHALAPLLFSNFAFSRPVYAIDSLIEQESIVWARTGRVDVTLQEVAARYAAEIRKLRSHGPYILAGYCLYGVLAFELAQQLESQGEHAALILLESFYLPGIRRRPAQTAMHIAYRLWQYLIANPKSLVDRMRRRRQRDKLRREMPANDVAFLDRNLCLRQIVTSYRAQPWAGTALLVRALQQRSRCQGFAGDGWDGLFTGELLVEDFACNHDAILQYPCTVEVANRMERHMSRWDARIPDSPSLPAVSVAI
jgi:thioesterase domain-containing protein